MDSDLALQISILVSLETKSLFGYCYHSLIVIRVRPKLITLSFFLLYYSFTYLGSDKFLLDLVEEIYWWGALCLSNLTLWYPYVVDVLLHQNLVRANSFIKNLVKTNLVIKNLEITNLFIISGVHNDWGIKSL